MANEMQKLHPRAFWLFFAQFTIKYLIFLLVIILFNTATSTYNGVTRGNANYLLAIPGNLKIAASELWRTNVQDSEVTVGGITIFVIIGMFIWAQLHYAYYRFGFLEENIYAKFGVLRKTEIKIPYNRIQHIETQRSITSRLFGLSEIRVFSAGGAYHELTIPGLSQNNAKQLISFALLKTAENVRRT